MSWTKVRPAPLSVTPAASRRQLDGRPFVVDADQGLRIVCVRDATSPLVALNIGFAIGSRDEAPGEHGFAHLFEHLMFAGTPLLSKGQFQQTVQGLGGNVNATTSTDLTSYYSTIPPDALSTVLSLEQYRFEVLVDHLTPSAVATEKGVVESERHLSVLSKPFGDARERLVAELFTDGHPYHHVPLADTADVQAADLDAILRFYDRHYRTAPAVVTLVGDIDPQRVSELAAEALGGGSWRRGTPGPSPDMGALREGACASDRHSRQRIESAHGRRVFIGFLVPAARTVEHDRCRILAQILAGGSDGLLQRRLGHDLGLLADVRLTFMAHLREATVCMVELMPTPGTDLERLADAYESVLAGLGPNDLSTAALSRGLGLHAAAWWSNRDRVAGRANDLVVGSLFLDSLDSSERTFDEVMATRRDDLLAGLAAFVSPTAATVLMYDVSA